MCSSVLLALQDDSAAAIVFRISEEILKRKVAELG